MRYLLLIFLVSILTQGFSQYIEYSIDDTIHVTSSPNYYNDPVDSTFMLNENRSDKKFRLYYDSTKTKTAQEITYNKFGHLDTNKEWFRNGKPKTIFFSNRRDTTINEPTCPYYEMTTFHENGKLKLEHKCSNDTSSTLEYYEDGQLAKKSLERSGSVFYTEEYYKNGQKKYDPVFIEFGKKSKMILYHENGREFQERTWYNYTLIGSYTEWYSNGKLKIKGQYEEDEKALKEINETNRSAKKTGTWTFYNSKGKIEKKEVYENGKLVKEQ